METMTPNSITSPKNGIKIRLPKSSIFIILVPALLLFFIGGTLLFLYIWDEISFPAFDRHVRQYWTYAGAFLNLLGASLCYTLIQWVFFYFSQGRKMDKIGWRFQFNATGYYPAKAIPLKKFRPVLLLPALLVGVLPLIHGYCTGNGDIYTFGLMGLLLSSYDVIYWFKLRRFDGEDLVQEGKKPYEATVIRRNYGKK